MWIVLVGGLMITLPATVVILFALPYGYTLWPAVASLSINMLPFLIAYIIMRSQAKKGGLDLEH
jgi:hypothetical protein